jgi:hypothetical protein
VSLKIQEASGAVGPVAGEGQDSIARMVSRIWIEAEPCKPPRASFQSRGDKVSAISIEADVPGTRVYLAYDVGIVDGRERLIAPPCFAAVGGSVVEDRSCYEVAYIDGTRLPAVAVLP